MKIDRVTEDLLRATAPRVLGALIRRYGQFDLCEDAVQEALLAAAQQWPTGGIPDNPRAWLTAVATRRLIDMIRADAARRHREDEATLAAASVAPAPDAVTSDRDDTLQLFLLCCHPAIAPASQLALTLRAVGGLTTVEIARALLTPEATIAHRISRAKRQIHAAGARFELGPDDWRDRLGVVQQVLYLIFNEGYTASAGTDLTRPDLTREAIRLARLLAIALPDDGETAGLLALMLLTDARRPARTTADGAVIPLAEQDRRQWDHTLIREGTALLQQTLPVAHLGPYQVQAAIAAVHAEANHADDTDRPQILALYDLLIRLAPSPVIELNRAVAVAMCRGAAAGLETLRRLDLDGRLPDQHRVAAVRGHLHELAGHLEQAAVDYENAAAATASLPEQRYLRSRAARLTTKPPADPRPHTDRQ